VENENQADEHLPRTRTKMMSRKNSRAKSFVLVNPEDNTIAVIEKSYMKGETIKHVTKRPRSLRKTRFQDETVCITYIKK
jgi:hypothetical protein